MSFRISVPSGYDLFASVHSWILPDIQPVPEITAPPHFYRVMTIDTDHIPVIVQQIAQGRPLNIVFDSKTHSKYSLKGKIRKILSLSMDISRALDVMEDDSRIANCVDTLSGIRPYLADSPFEALVKTILQQQISYRAANVITNRLVLGLSKPTELRKLQCHRFPSPEAFVNAGIDGLRRYGLGYKAENIYRISNLVVEGTLELNEFDSMTEDQIDETLIPIKGIGDWTVQVFILAALGGRTSFPYDDLGIRNLMGLLYNDGIRMTKRQVIDQAARWGSEGPLVLYLLMCGEILGLDCLKQM